METWLKETLWRQFGAAIDMLERAIDACPDHVWGDRSSYHEFWYMVYHTLFWLDYYLEGSEKDFAPPPPFTLDECDPAGVLPDRVYTRSEMRTYLAHGRAKCRRTIAALTTETARQPCGYAGRDLTVLDLHLYNMRHVQHHTAQLNLLLRQRINDAPRWVGKTSQPL